MTFVHLGTISYTLDQVSLGNEYFGVQSNGDFYLKTGLTTFSNGQTLSLTATVTDSGGLTGTCYCIVVNVHALRFINDETCEKSFRLFHFVVFI